MAIESSCRCYFGKNTERIFFSFVLDVVMPWVAIDHKQISDHAMLSAGMYALHSCASFSLCAASGPRAYLQYFNRVKLKQMGLGRTDGDSFIAFILAEVLSWIFAWFFSGL